VPGARRPDRRRSQAGGLGQVDAEAVAPTLVAISAVAWPRWRWTVRSSAAVASPARSEWSANSWRRLLSLSVENFHRQFSGANCLLQVKQGDFRSPVNS